MRLCWITDIHLDFVNNENINLFLDNIIINNIDGIIVTGDISNSNRIISDLKHIYDVVNKPIYFVAGNHDFYGSSIYNVNKKIEKLTKNNNEIIWLTKSNPIELIPYDTYSIGHDSWYDGGYGDYANSSVYLNDFNRIIDFIGLDKWGRLKKFEKLADESVKHIYNQLELVFSEYNANTVYLAMHCSPFKESSIYNGVQSDDNWLPYFSSKVMGDLLIEIMSKYKDRNLIVLCGHSHGFCDINILNNLRVKLGQAEYHYPTISEIIKI